MAAQTATNKKTGNKMKGFFKGVKAEIKKVSWPSRKELINHTGVVIAVCAIVGLIIWLLDTGLHKIFSLIIG